MATSSAFAWLASRDFTDANPLFHPHGYCYLWLPSLVAAHVVADALIALSYLTISLTLVYLVRQTRREIPFSWMFLAFGAFIVACGATHAMEIVTLWKPLFWLAADVKIVTAAASVITAVALPPLVPRVIDMVTAAGVSKRQQQINRDLEAQNMRVESASRLKSAFLANMSHELRTPLNAIIGFSQLMHRGKVGPVSAAHEEYLGYIVTSSTHLLALINDVLDLSKVEAGKMEFRLEQVDLVQLVTEVRDTVSGLAVSQGVAVSTEVEPAVRAAVVDPARVKQILYNYLSNAIKFTPAGGRVRVVIAAETDREDFFRLDVHDTGVGIALEDQGHLFVEFQQLDAGLTKTHQGTGLGLALVKRIAGALGGHVSVRSARGVGSTFSAVLPRGLTTRPAAWGAPVIASQPGHDAILVVDDDVATLKLADVALRERGLRPICKTNAIEALLAAEADPPAAVIVDLLMPHVDGFEFILRLRALTVGRHVPILVWTAKDLDAVELGRLDASVVAIASKRAGGSQALIDALQPLLASTTPHERATPPGA
jgi:signal transduction histidine kinase